MKYTAKTDSFFPVQINFSPIPNTLKMASIQTLFDTMLQETFAHDHLTNYTSNTADDLDDFARQVQLDAIAKEFVAELDITKPTFEVELESQIRLERKRRNERDFKNEIDAKVGSEYKETLASMAAKERETQKYTPRTRKDNELLRADIQTKYEIELRPKYEAKLEAEVKAILKAKLDGKRRAESEEYKQLCKREAESATNINREDARKDLFLNKDNPYLFQKYMKEFRLKRMTEFGVDEDSYVPPEKHYAYAQAKESCSREVANLMHGTGEVGGRGCGGNHREGLDTNKINLCLASQPGEQPGTLKGGLGVAFPCYSDTNGYNGGRGRCWDATLFDGRPGIRDSHPFKIDWTLPESWT